MQGGATQCAELVAVSITLEEGNFGSNGSGAHKVAISGDTFSDPYQAPPALVRPGFGRPFGYRRRELFQRGVRLEY